MPGAPVARALLAVLDEPSFVPAAEIAEPSVPLRIHTNPNAASSSSTVSASHVLFLDAMRARIEHVRMRMTWALLLAFVACGGDDERPASWSYIHAAIIVPNCATSGCHSSLNKTRGLSFIDRDEARSIFIGWPVEISLLDGTRPDKPRMPPDQPLPQADIELIRRWIDAGQGDN